MLPNKEEGAVLLDFYGDLLTNHQQEVLIEYYNEDLSMNEIAENSKISKAAISDLIKRSTNQLLEYEKKLGLIKNDKDLSSVIMQMDNSGIDEIRRYAQMIKEIIRR